uniref:Uncharacterized protein n=1 Tax=viral metagenome TaxID=1070528 RepID=A0A6M3LGH6_9ZZZZ
MLGMVSFYNPDEHSIIPGALSEFCKRLVENDPKRKGKLFVVRYNKLGVFVIAEWLAKPKDVFVDIMNLGKSLSSFTRDKASELRHRLFAPITAAETDRLTAGADSDYHHEMQDFNESETERLAKCEIGE